MSVQVFDGRFQHPFTCVISSPSRSGKSTFMRNLLLHQEDLIDVKFDYICIFLGTSVSENRTLGSLGAILTQRVNVLDIKDRYPSKEDLAIKFPSDLNSMLRKQSDQHLKGCLIFDDLMDELSQCGVLTKLFTKYSSHYDVSIINITQNLFHHSVGKSEHTTVYRNTRLMVIFNNPIDNSVLTVVAKRLKLSGSSPLINMLNYIVRNHRYVVINADLEGASELKFTTDIFAREPVPHQNVFLLREDSSSEDEGS